MKELIDERIDVRVEVEDSHVVIVFPRKMDSFPTPWEHAYELGTVLEMAAKDVPNPSPWINYYAVREEVKQIKCSYLNEKHVELCFDWTDRIQFTPMAAVLMGRKIRKRAQDIQFMHTRKIKFEYGANGMIKALHNAKTGTSQIIPGR